MYYFQAHHNYNCALRRLSLKHLLSRVISGIGLLSCILAFAPGDLTGQPYLSTDQVPPCYEIQARIRNGQNQYEAVLFTPSTPTPSQPGGLKWKMNPAGSPIWDTNGNHYGDLHTFAFQYAASTGETHFQVDFNRDNDFTDPLETIINTAPTLEGKGFKYINVMLQGNETGKTVTLHDLNINGSSFGFYNSASNNPLHLLFEDQDGLFTNIFITGTFSFTGYGSEERPRLWIRLKQPNIAPVCMLVQPENGSVFDSTEAIILTATATDFHPIMKMEFYAGQTKIGEDTQAPYNMTWINPPLGGHVLRAKAIDSDEAQGLSEPVLIAVGDSSSLPQDTLGSSFALVSLTYPANNAILYDPDTLTILTQSTDTAGLVAFVDFILNDEVIGRDSFPPYQFPVINPPMGQYTLKVRTSRLSGAANDSAQHQFTVRCIREDINIDGVVNTFDFLLLLAAYGNDCQVQCIEDFNDDGAVGAFDFLRILAVFGYSCL